MPGTDTMQRIRALHTPLQEVTVGSGCKLKMQTCPTYPSLLHTQTSFPLYPNVGAAQVNCKPARVFRIGTVATSSGQGLLSPDIANLCFVSLKDSSQDARFSGFKKAIEIFSTPLLKNILKHCDHIIDMYK